MPTINWSKYKPIQCLPDTSQQKICKIDDKDLLILHTFLI